MRLIGDRSFQVWEYQRAQRQLLLRSPKSPGSRTRPARATNVDILFHDVEYWSLPTHFDRLTFDRATGDELRRTFIASGEPRAPEAVTMLVADGRRYPIVASSHTITEHDWGLFESPIPIRSRDPDRASSAPATHHTRLDSTDHSLEPWEFLVSDRQLLLRSASFDGSPNLDAIFTDVEFMSLPSGRDRLALQVATAEDLRALQSAWGYAVDGGRVTMAVSGAGRRYPIVASRPVVSETTWGPYESPLEPKLSYRRTDDAPLWLLEWFFREEATPDTCRAMASTLRDAYGPREFHGNVFHLDIDLETGHVIVSSDIDASPTGVLVLTLGEFADALHAHMSTPPPRK